MKKMIISYARRLSGSWEPKQNAKKKAQIAPALHRCDKCGSYNYEGDSQKNFDKYVKQFPNNLVNFKGIQLDHIQPVVQISGWTSWDHFFESLFCEEDNYRALCVSCHDAKTRNENVHRKSFKKGNK